MKEQDAFCRVALHNFIISAMLVADIFRTGNVSNEDIFLCTQAI